MELFSIYDMYIITTAVIMYVTYQQLSIKVANTAIFKNNINAADNIKMILRGIAIFIIFLVIIWSIVDLLAIASAFKGS